MSYTPPDDTSQLYNIDWNAVDSASDRENQTAQAMQGGFEGGPPPDPYVADQMLGQAQSYQDKRRADLQAAMANPEEPTDSSGLPGGSAGVGPIATARANWDPNWGPPPGASRTGTINGAIDTTSSAGQPNLQTGQIYVPTAAERQGILPGSSPTTTATATAPGVSGGLPGSGSGGITPDQFEQQFRNKYNFFDERYNSMANMEHNLLEGDTNIRQQAEYMAQFDPNLRLELDAINARPDFYRGQNAVQHQLLHNQSLADQAAQGAPQGGMGGQGVNGRLGAQPGRAPTGGPDLAWLRSQAVDVPTNPVDNAHAYLTDTMRAQVVDSLAKLGATDFKMGFDNAGNMALTYTSKSGTPEKITASLVDYANAMEELRQRTAAAQPPAPTGGGGGYGNGYTRPTRSYRDYTKPDTTGQQVAGNGAVIDQTDAGGGYMLPGLNPKPGYYPDVQAYSYQNQQGGTSYKNPSGAMVFYTPEGEPYSYYYGNNTRIPPGQPVAGRPF